MPWRGAEEPGEFPTGGYIVQDWIEANFVITDGPKIGQPVRLYDEQVMHLLHRYRLDPDAAGDLGNDAFRNGGSQLIRGQKWGKDPLLAMVDLAHAFGPCDFAGWDAAGEPVLKPHPSPWVFVAALNDLQANNTWLPLKAMLELSELADLPGVDITMDLIRLPCGNPLERLTTTAFGRLGGRFTAGSLTENGLMTGTGEGGNTGKRSPLSFARTLLRSVSGMSGMWIGASNTWDPTEYSHAQQVVEAKDPHTYVDAKLSRGRVDLDDDDKLRDELRYLYGDSIQENGGHVSSQRLMRDCRNAASGESEIRRFFLSEILAGEEPLCTPARWAALARPPGHPEHDPLIAGEAISLGFDGSRSRDATMLTACRIRDGRIFHLGTWLPECLCVEPNHRPEQCRERKVDRVAVDRAVTDAFAGYDVHFMLADPYKWQDYLDLWSARWPTRRNALGKSHPIVIEQPTNVEVRMDLMLERFTTARDRSEITHEPDPDLTQHVADTVIAKGRRKPSKIREDDAGRIVEHYLKLAKKREGVLIDGSVSMVLAFEGRGMAIEQGALNLRPTPESPMGLDAEDDEPVEAAGPLDGLPDLNTIQF